MSLARQYVLARQPFIDSLPLMEKVAPLIASLIVRDDVMTNEVIGNAVFNAVIILADLFIPEKDDFTLPELEKRIVNDANKEALLRAANEKMVALDKSLN